MDKSPQIGDLCLKCQTLGLLRKLRTFYINYDEQILKCESDACLYPYEDDDLDDVNDDGQAAEQAQMEVKTSFSYPTPDSTPMLPTVKEELAPPKAKKVHVQSVVTLNQPLKVNVKLEKANATQKTQNILIPKLNLTRVFSETPFKNASNKAQRKRKARAEKNVSTNAISAISDATLSNALRGGNSRQQFTDQNDLAAATTALTTTSTTTLSHQASQQAVSQSTTSSLYAAAAPDRVVTRFATCLAVFGFALSSFSLKQMLNNNGNKSNVVPLRKF